MVSEAKQKLDPEDVTRGPENKSGVFISLHWKLACLPETPGLLR